VTAGEKAIIRRHRSGFFARTVCALVSFGFVALIVQPAPATHDPAQGHHTFTGPIGLQWQNITDADAPFADIVALAVSPDGASVFITGTSDSAGTGRDYLTRAFDAATGTTLWSARFDAATGNPDVADAPRGIAVSPDGTMVFVTGDSEIPAGIGTAIRILTVAYDATSGTELWSYPYDGDSQPLTATGIVAEPSGAHVLIVGRSSTHIKVVQHDAETGELGWSLAFVGDELPTATTIAPGGGRLFVVGRTQSAGVNGAMLIHAIDLTTLDAWSAFFDGTGGGNDIAEGVAVGPDSSRVFVTGTTLATGGHINYATVAYNAATGAQQWASESPDGSAHDVAVSPDGTRVFVTGEKTVLRTYYDQDCSTVAYDAATGVELWTAAFNGPNNRDDQAFFVTAALGQVYISGVGGLDSNDDFLTIAYDESTGAQVWLATSDGAASGPDAPTGLSALGGRIFIAGHIKGFGPNFDLMTVAYCGSQFADVPCNYWAFRFVGALVAADIAAGYPDGTFHPEALLTRAQLAVFAARAVDRTDHDLATFTPPACGQQTFKDVPCTHWAFRFIEYVAAKGLAAGTGSGAFSPDSTLRRTQMAVMLARLRDRLDGDFAAFTPPPCGSESFPDVPCTWADYKAIEYLKSKGVASGFGDGTFRPLALVTRAQLAVFLVRALQVAN